MAAKLYSTPTTLTPTSSIKNYFVSTVDIKEKGSLMSSSDQGNPTNGSGSNHPKQHANANTITITTPSGQTTTTNNNSNNIINNNITNMVPIISVTPHSPSTKYYNSILEDSLNHLQSIRESVAQMKNSSAQNTNFGNIGIINPTVGIWNFKSSFKLFVKSSFELFVKSSFDQDILNFNFLPFQLARVIKNFLFVSIFTQS